MTKVLLFQKDPTHQIRVVLFKKTLESLGYDVVLPDFKTRNWIKILFKSPSLVKEIRPNIIHVFNALDVLYKDIPKLKGKYYEKLLYDYRSPWDIELQMMFHTPIARLIGEHYIKRFVNSSDIITTVSTPLMERMKRYTNKSIHVIPNYPSASFTKSNQPKKIKKEGKIILYLGALCYVEGSKTLARLIKNLADTDITFWIVGEGHDFKKLKDKFKDHKNTIFFGWQSHEKIPQFIKNSDICIVPREHTLYSKYATDESVWKLNEYLNLGKKVIATGISKQNERKNLIFTSNDLLEEVILEEIEKPAQKLNRDDYRTWESSSEKIIKKVYDIASK